MRKAINKFEMLFSFFIIICMLPSPNIIQIEKQQKRKRKRFVNSSSFSYFLSKNKYNLHLRVLFIKFVLLEALKPFICTLFIYLLINLNSSALWTYKYVMRWLLFCFAAVAAAAAVDNADACTALLLYLFCSIKHTTIARATHDVCVCVCTHTYIMKKLKWIDLKK